MNFPNLAYVCNFSWLYSKRSQEKRWGETRNQRFSVRRTSVSSVSLSQSVNSQSVSQSVNCQSMTHRFVISYSWSQCFALWLHTVASHWLVISSSGTSASHCLVISSSWRQCFALACCLFSLSPVLRTGLSLQLDGSASHWLYSFMPQSQCWRTALFTFSLASFLDQS